jgi:hypothetical protein
MFVQYVDTLRDVQPSEHDGNPVRWPRAMFSVQWDRVLLVDGSFEGKRLIEQ